MLTNRAQLPSAELADLDRELAPLGMLEAVVRWGFSQTPRADIAEVIIQDEYTHDVLMLWRGERWLTFATT